MTKFLWGFKFVKYITDKKAQVFKGCGMLRGMYYERVSGDDPIKYKGHEHVLIYCPTSFYDMSS